MSNIIWMVVSDDKYELPLCVGTREQVAKFAGTSVDVVSSAVCHARKRAGRSKFVKVVCED